MKLVVFGLTITSSWGNGHATLWRGLCRALARIRCQVVFFERSTPYYAAARDLAADESVTLRVYADWREARESARQAVRDCDAVIVTSFCPDAVEASSLARDAGALSVFYDLDTPVTLKTLERGRPSYIGPRGLADYDLVLSYAGGPSLDALREKLGARRVAPLYGHADPERYAPAPAEPAFEADLGYLGTYAHDRQPALQRYLVDAAYTRPDARFCIGGAQYPADFPWASNIFFVRHVSPPQHPAFFSSARLQLNVTRPDMREAGYCPSGRLFEATACGAPVLTDDWPGLEQFFEPDREILVARSTADVLAALDRGDAELQAVAAAGRARTLSTHTSMHRARALLAALDDVSSRRPLRLEDA